MLNGKINNFIDHISWLNYTRHIENNCHVLFYLLKKNGYNYERGGARNPLETIFTSSRWKEGSCDVSLNFEASRVDNILYGEKTYNKCDCFSMVCVICWTHFSFLTMCLICSTEQLSGVELWPEVEWPVWLSLTLPSNAHVISIKHTSLGWWWCAKTETNNTMRIANQILNMDIFFIITMQRYPFNLATRLQRLIIY